jgi:hypothetical protein
MEHEMASNLPCFTHQQLESICRVLGDTDRGLTGAEIGHLLANKCFEDPTPQITKWQRLFNALAAQQNKHGVGNHTIQFINEAMSPSLYLRKPEVFAWRRENLNSALALCGYRVREDGQVGHAQKASTLDEALSRANRLTRQSSNNARFIRMFSPFATASSFRRTISTRSLRRSNQSRNDSSSFPEERGTAQNLLISLWECPPGHLASQSTH